LPPTQPEIDNATEQYEETLKDDNSNPEEALKAAKVSTQAMPDTTLGQAKKAAELAATIVKDNRARLLEPT